jgi:putative molybdopterin biosynthesis protein
VHRAEAFLLEVLTAGYSPPEVEESVRLALDRWRVISHEPGSPTLGTVRFSGSHDLVVAWLGGHFADVAPGFTLSIQFTGSLGGLIALAERKADLAGCHLWDEESDTYNLPFVRRIMPGRRVALVTLAHRCIGLIVSPGNPAGYRSLHDVVDAGARFVNRQSGSGTRVWLDASLRRMGIPTSTLLGYEMEKATHSEVARAIAGGEAEVGLGLEAAAHAFGLGFVPLTRERYDMAIPAEQMDTEPLHKLVNWLGGSTANTTISDLAGYDTSETGKIRWVE